MVRRYEETIEVREGVRDDLTLGPGGQEGQGQGGLGGEGAVGPDAFVWRGRLYVVPGRPAWNSQLTVVQFLATGVALGPAAAAIIDGTSTFSRTVHCGSRQWS